MEFAGVATAIIAGFPKGRRPSQIKIDRASTPIVLNIAEGSGEHSRKEKARFDRMALRSAAECSAILALARQAGALAPDDFERGKALLLRMGAMLTALAKRDEP